MIDIYICEDSEEQREAITHYVESAVLIREYDMKIKISTNSPEKIIEELKLSDNTGIYFLDIDLQSTKNGILLAKEIREYDPRGFIIFVTSHSEMSFLTFQYKVEALDFILKDEQNNHQQRNGEWIEDAHKKYKKITRGVGKTISIMRGSRKIILEYDNIMFFETSANEHKLIVHADNKNIEFFGKMKDIEEEVGNEFIRCHRAYLVNKKNIKEINYAEKIIVMKNKANCPISHRMLRKIKMNTNL